MRTTNRAVGAWASQLAGGGRYDPAIASAQQVADVMDAIYGR